jgi:hypothetical protein
MVSYGGRNIMKKCFLVHISSILDGVLVDADSLLLGVGGRGDERRKKCLTLCISRAHSCQWPVALPSTLKSILRQKKNYGNSNISPCKNIILKKTKILQHIITL